MNKDRIIFRSMLVALTPMIGVITGIITNNLLLQYTDIDSTFGGFLALVSGVLSSFGFGVSNVSYFDED